MVKKSFSTLSPRRVPRKIIVPDGDDEQSTSSFGFGGFLDNSFASFASLMSAADDNDDVNKNGATCRRNQVLHVRQPSFASLVSLVSTADRDDDEQRRITGDTTTTEDEDDDDEMKDQRKFCFS